MSEQPALTFGELLRQLRAASRLTQEELAEAAQVSARSVSDLERGVNRTARKVTAELLAQVLGLTGQSRELFVAAARGFGPAEDVLIALRSLPGADGLPASGRQAGRPASQWAMTESPYRGMRAFGEQHEEMFGGREAAAAQVLERLARLAAGAGTLVVSGVSGAGKTSLLQAGVLPQIRRAGLAAAPAAASWPCLVFSPGYDPLAELAVRVAPLIGVDAPVLRDRLAEVPAGFALTARQAAPDGRLLLVIDQCEQLFTLCESGAWRQAFVAALQAASAPPHPGALVVLVVRADFEARLADFPELGTAVQDRYLLTAMTARQLQLAITRPAEAVGARVDDDLVQVLLAEVRERRGAVAASGGQAGAGVLPLLSHALDQAWRTRAGPTLSLADYERTGGIQGAVAVSAQRGYDQLTPTQQEAARQVFTRLTAAGEDGTDTAARTARADLIAGRDAAGVKDVEVVLETFTAERLLTLDAATVEITHEALLTAWPLLRDTWLTDARADRAARTRLSASAAEWTAANRDAAYLYHGSRLDAAVATAARIEADPRHAPLSQAETDFLGASRRSGRRRTRGRRQVLVALVALVAGLTVVSVAAVGADREAVRQGNNAAAQRDVATAQRNLAAARLLISESGANSDANVTIADIESVAAWTVDPSAQSRAALLAATANPETATITASDDLGVSSVAVSPDGKILATGSDTVQLWDVATRRRLGPPLAAAGVLGFTDNGKLLVTEDHGGVVQMWDVATERPVAKITLGASSVSYEAALSSDGKTLVTATATAAGHAVLRLWDVATGKPVATSATISPFPNLLQLSPDGKTLVAGSGTGTAQLWRAAGGQLRGGPVLRGTGSTKDIYAVAFSPDGKTIAAAEREEDYPVSFDSGGTNPTSEKDVTPLANDRVQLWDTATGRPAGRPFSNAVDGDYALAFSPDGTELATGGTDGTVRLFDPAGGQLIAGPFASSGGASVIAFSPDGGTLVTGNSDGTARLWDMASATFRQLGTGAPIYSVSYTWAAFTPHDKTLITVTGNGVMQVWDLQTGRQIDKTPLFWTQKYGFIIPLPGSIALSPDGTTLATGGVARTSKTNSAQLGMGVLWDVTTGQVIGAAHPPGATQVAQMAFTPDGNTLIAVTGPAEEQVWNLATNAPGEPRHVADADALKLAQDGITFATDSAFGPVRLLSDVTGDQVGRPLAAHFGPISWLALSSNGKTLAVGAANGAARFFDVATGRLISSMSGAYGVTSAVFSPDGTVLATFAAGSNGSGPVQLWDVASGQPIGGPVGGDSSAALAFSQDGRTLAIVNADGAVQLWNIGYLTDPLAQLCARIGGSITAVQWAQYVPAGPSYRNACPR